MKRNYKIAIFSLLMIIGLFGYQTASAFFMPQLAIDNYPMPDFIDNLVSLKDSAGELGQTAMKTKNTTESTMNNVKTAAQAVYSGSPTSLLDVGGINPGQKAIVDCSYKCKKIKMTKSADIAEASRLLFTQYPVNPRVDVAAAQKYDAYRRKFYRDNVVEIYAAILALEKDLEASTKPMVDETIKCVKGESSSCGIPSPDGNNDSAFVEGKALEATANLYEMLLKVTALKAQLASVKAINAIAPAEPVDGVEDTPVTTKEEAAETPQQQTALDGKVFYAKASLKTTQSLAFAQVGMVGKSGSVVSLSDIETKAKISDTASSKFVSSTLSFVTVDENPETHPYTDAADKMAELEKIAPISALTDKAAEAHNLIVKLPEYKGAAETLNEVKEAHKRALDSLKVSNQCAVSYLSRRYSNPDVAWAGGGLGSNINNADIRRGISGWALEAFETAKSAQVTDRGSDNVVDADIDTDAHDLSDISNTNKNSKVMKAAGAENVSTNKKEQAAREARETKMISWQIGSEASEMLASAPSKWGTPSKKTAVWADTKTFYKQYLDFKYQNIRTHLKSYSKNDILAIVAERLRGNSAVNIKDNKKQKAMAEANSQLSKDLASASVSSEKEVQAVASATQGQVNNLQSKRKNILAQMDVVSAKQKELADKISDLRNKAQDDAASSMQETVTYKAAFPEGRSYEVANANKDVVRTVKDKDETLKEFNQSSAENKANSEIDSVKQLLEKENQKIANLETQLANVDKEIAAQRLGTGGKISSLLEKLFASKAQKSDAVANKISELDKNFTQDAEKVLTDVLQNKVTTSYPLDEAGKAIAGSSPLMSPKIAFVGINAAAGKALDDLYDKVDARIALAQKQLENMKDDLYSPASHSRVVEIHTSMINDIKAMSLVITAAGVGTINDIMVYAFLEEADISADTDFFVGAAAKARDLRAPKQIFEFDLPPLREAVHFDEVDWQNVLPYSQGVSKSSNFAKTDFLNYGGKIPGIWKQMLQENAFVERGMDLKSALNQGCEAVAFYRGGVMPCKVKNSAIVLDVDENGQYIKGEATGKLSECPGIEMKSGKPYHNLREVGITLVTFSLSNLTITKPKAAEPIDCPYSELGTLLDADASGNVSFRQSANDAFYNIVYEQKNTDKEQSDKQKQQLTIYDQASLNRDQIGDFLSYFENEQIQRKNLEETQKDYDAMQAELVKWLEEYGFTPSKSFDMSKDSDYNLARQKLDSIKNNLVAKANQEIAQVDVADNAVVAERVNIIKSMIAALQKDSDETTNIASGVDDNNRLDEEIKSSKVNNEVANRFSKSLDDAAKKAKNGLEPYCPNY